MADVYEHLTPETKKHTLEVLQARWETSIAWLCSAEREQLRAVVPPRLSETITESDGRGPAETHGSAQRKDDLQYISRNSLKPYHFDRASVL